MFCPNCGNNLPDGCNFCAQCGTNLTTENTEKASDVTPNNYNTVSKQKKPKKKLDAKRVIILVAVIIVASLVGRAIGGGIAGTMNSSSGNTSNNTTHSTSNQFDFGETPSVGIRENVETMVFETNIGNVLSSQITFSYENGAIICVKGYYNIYDLTADGADSAKSTIDFVYDAVKQADLYNVNMTVIPGVNSIECNFNFTSLDGNYGKEATQLAADLIGLTVNSDGKMYISTVKDEMLAFGYNLVDTY